MYAIGIDIGTTSICATVIGCDNACVVKSVTLPNDSYIRGESFESLQDPDVILNTVLDLCGQMCAAYNPVKAIGLSCQMHGILYVDGRGECVSPLYTWQDGRGDLAYSGGLSYARRLEGLTGRGGLATGFGAVTHFYNTLNGVVPEGAAGFCSIGDYAAMKLTGGRVCAAHESNAASFSLYDISGGRFDAAAIEKAGMDPAMFPEVKTGCALFGETAGAISGVGAGTGASTISGVGAGAGAGASDSARSGIMAGIPVSYCIGDNQAGFIGAVADPDSSVLINIGTGGQISVCGTETAARRGIEIRPLAGGRYLQVGATLCAGKAYEALERFYASVLEMAGVKANERLYGAMGAALDIIWDGRGKNGGGDDGFDELEVSTRFSGTRENPGIRGAIGNIGLDNFTPAHLTLGVLKGIADELYGLYELMDGGSLAALREFMPSRRVLVGAGNGLRKNPHLRKIISERFGMPLAMPKHIEEAAFGSALYALAACGYYPSLAEAQARIQYI